MRFFATIVRPLTLLLLLAAVWSGAPAQTPPIYVPDLRGSTLPRAIAMLERIGLQRGSVSQQSSRLPAGTVISQFPRAGTPAQLRGRVDIVLSEARSTVPDVTGRTVIQADQILEKAGLRRGAVTQQRSPSRAGTVISQSPRPSTPAQPGMTVDLVVAAGQPDVPDLTGRTLRQAIALLRQAGLERGIVSQLPSESPAGTVISQFPRAGTTVQLGRMVNLTIASAAPPAEEPAP